MRKSLSAMVSMALLMIGGSLLPINISGQAAATNQAPAQTVSVDTNFVPRFEITGTVVASAVQPDNKVIIAGDFDSVNGIPRKGIARLNADGSLDRTFELKVSGSIDNYYALALQSDGKMLVAGYMFIVADASTDSIRQYMVRLNPDGTLDASFDVGAYFPKLQTDNYIKTIAVQKDGKIMVGGDFTKIHTISRNHIARLNADGSLDASFDPGEGANGAVLALALQPDGKILMGGDFTLFNRTNLNHIGRLNGDGSQDASFAVGSGVNSTVRAIAVQPNGRIAIGGSFTNPRNFLARFEADGRLDGNLNDFHYYGVDAIVALPDNRIVVGGWNPVMIFGGYPTDHNGRVMTFQDNGVAANGKDFAGKPTDVLTLTRRSDGKIICGGSFRQTDEMNPIYRSGLCLLSDLLQVDAGFAPIVGIAGTVNSIQKQPDGKILAGGSFNLVNGVAQTNLARLNTDGSLDATFKPARVGYDPVTSLALQPDGMVVAVGHTLNRLKPDGAMDTTFTYQTNAVQAPVSTVALQPDGKIIAAGTSMEARKGGILRINPDGVIDSSFNVGSGIPSTFLPNPGQGMQRINSLAIQADGKIVAAGAFTLFNNEARTNLVRLNQDGSVDGSFLSAAFTSFSSYYAPVFDAVAVQSDGKIMVGGYFSTVAGRSSPSVARLNPDGSFDPSFLSPINDSGGTVNVILNQANGLLLIGGGFWLLSTSADYANSLIRLAPNGAKDPGFGISATGAGVYAINIPDPGNILVGGAFSAINETALFSTARLQTTPSGSGVTAPVITSPVIATAAPGSAFAYQIAAANNPAGYGASGLPDGLALNTSSGVISGTLTNSGTYSVGIAAFNAAGAGTATLAIAISNVVPRPQLSVSLLAGQQALVSWPASFTGFVLESTDNLTIAQWQPVPNPPATVVDRSCVTNDAASGARYFRLRK